MIIVNLKGGLGNQMFQYALGRHLSLKRSDLMKLDIGGLIRANAVGDIYRPFDLEAFNIKKDIATQDEIQRLKYPFGIFSKVWRYLSFRISRDKNTIFHPAVLDWKGDIFLDGYWQSPKYFEDIRDVLLTEFTLSARSKGYEKWVSRIVSDPKSVSVHVRRGDYVTNLKVLSEFGACSLAYYARAIDRIKTMVPDASFYVFSDDTVWARDNLPLSDKAIYVQDTDLTTPEEMMLMSNCTHNIIANSTFSWWGAWLNANPDKIVIAPVPWFDKVPYDKGLIPHTWITLPKN